MFGVYPLLHEDPRYNLSGSRYSPEALEQAKKLLRGAVVQVGKYSNGRLAPMDIGYIDGLEIYEGTLYGTLVTLPHMHPAFHPKYSMHPPNYYRIQVDSTVTVGSSPPHSEEHRSGGTVREIIAVQCWFIKKECLCAEGGVDRCPLHGEKAEVLTGYHHGSLQGRKGQEFQAPEMNTATMSDQSKPQPTDFPITIPVESVRDLTKEQREELIDKAWGIHPWDEKTFSLTPPLTMTPTTRLLEVSGCHNETGQTPVQLISDWTYYHSLEHSATPYHLAVMMGSVEKVVEVYRNIQKQLGALGRDCTIQADLNDCYLRAVLQADREPPYIHVYSQDESGKGGRYLGKIHFFTPELFRDLSPQIKLSFSHFRYIAVDATMTQEDRDLLRPHQRGEWREW